MKIFNKIKEVGLKNTIIGTFKRFRYKLLQKKYNFDSWHISPYELREYAQAVAEYVSNKDCKDGLVIDLGCGLGEVIANIKQDKRIGYDVNKTLIELAPSLHKKENITFRNGTFDEICDDYQSGTKVAYFITLAFMQGSTEDKWKDLYHKVAKHFDVEHFLIDTHKEGVNNAHRLNFKKILPENYILEERMGPFLSERFVEIYKKVY